MRKEEQGERGKTKDEKERVGEKPQAGTVAHHIILFAHGVTLFAQCVTLEQNFVSPTHIVKIKVQKVI